MGKEDSGGLCEMVEALLRNKPTSMEGFTEPTQE